MESGLVLPAGDLRLDLHGAELRPGVLDAVQLSELRRLLGCQPVDRAGVRLFGVEGLAAFLDAEGQIGRVAGASMTALPRPVRAILFDKTPAMNWSLAWHQDRVIAVRQRVELVGFGPWSRKAGAEHVAPPPELLSRMTTLRVHLDDVSLTNAPLLVAPGSHRFGRVPEHQVQSVVRECGVAACPAAAGDVWVYSTPILHASEAAIAPTRRRVLQVDYAAEGLPGGLEWLGVS